MLKKTKFKVPKCDKNISKMFEKYEKKRIKIYKTDHVHIIYVLMVNLEKSFVMI